MGLPDFIVSADQEESSFDPVTETRIEEESVQPEDPAQTEGEVDISEEAEAEVESEASEETETETEASEETEAETEADSSEGSEADSSEEAETETETEFFEEIRKGDYASIPNALYSLFILAVNNQDKDELIVRNRIRPSITP